MADYVMWHAIHDACPPDGCESCTPIDLEFSDEEWASIEDGARRRGEPVDVYLHRCVVLGIEACEARACA